MGIAHPPGVPAAQGWRGEVTTVWQGRVMLNWRDRKPLTHRAGCLLCCTYRIRIGGREVHPGVKCPQCGSAWDRRRPDLCRICGHTAHFLEAGRPVHKACLETELTDRPPLSMAA